MHTKTVRKFSEWRGLPAEKTPMTQKARDFIIQMVEDELYNDHDCLVKSKTPREQLDALVDANYYIEDTCAKHGFDTEEVILSFPVVGLAPATEKSMLSATDVSECTDSISARLDKLVSTEDATQQEIILCRVIEILRARSAQMGADIDELFLIVHAANMRKIDPSTRKPFSIREDGKVMKPYKKDGFAFDWYGPEKDMDAELTRQGF